MILQATRFRTDMQSEGRQRALRLRVDASDRMQNYAQPQLTLDQAYQAAYLWLDRIDQPPATISEPTDGVIEMRSERLLARIRWSRSPINQAAVLAILRVPIEDEKRVVFSVTGFTPGAVSLADTQSVALFTFDEVGAAKPENAHAIALVPEDEGEPPFAPTEVDTLADDDEPRDEPAVNYDLSDWIECPTCGTTHHRVANFCRACGSKLHGEPNGGPGVAPAAEVASQPQPAPMLSGPASPLILPGTTRPPTGHRTTLRCRTCGSDDIELLRP